MGEIDFTNIIIDDFRKGKLNPFTKYIYILTHIHSDHLRGLSNSWNYGPVYCSQITAALITNKFPNMKNVVKLIPYQEPTVIQLAENLEATITFFDANHCGGAVVVLLQGYFGRFLYTGDFRFDRQIFSRYSYLYPSQSRNEKLQNCSKHIDKLWLDNTFCNQRFNFPKRQDAFKLLEQFVEDKLGKRIYVGMDNYGKQQALVHLAIKFETIIIVDQLRYQTIIAMEYDREHFSTNPQEGLIQVLPKKRFKQKMSVDPQSFGLIMSGWCNVPYWSKDKRIYHVPYSLHSNYNEIVSFVKSVKPSLIEPIVTLQQTRRYQQNSISLFNTNDQYSTEGNADAFRGLVKNHTCPISQNYKAIQNDEKFIELLKEKFGIDKKSVIQGKLTTAQSNYTIPPKGKGYKIENQRDEQQIEKVKEFLKSKRCINRQQIKQIIISQDGDDGDSDQIQEIIEEEEGQVQQIQHNTQKQKMLQNSIPFSFENYDNKQLMKQKIDKKTKVKNKINRKRLQFNCEFIDMNDFKDIKILHGKEDLQGYFYAQLKGNLYKFANQYSN